MSKGQRVSEDLSCPCVKVWRCTGNNLVSQQETRGAANLLPSDVSAYVHIGHTAFHYLGKSWGPVSVSIKSKTFLQTLRSSSRNYTLRPYHFSSDWNLCNIPIKDSSANENYFSWSTFCNSAAGREKISPSTGGYICSGDSKQCLTMFALLIPG
jgi:hypothetical protein